MLETIMAAISGVFAIMWYLLKQKDERQGKDIESLYRMHHEDASKLAVLELEIAKNHYPKHELDERFKQIDTTLKEGFRDLSSDIKHMTKALNDHLQEGRNN